MSADSAFQPRATCNKVPTDVPAIPATKMFGGFPQYGGGSQPPGPPDPIKEATPDSQSPPMQVGGSGGGTALIAVMETGGGPGPGTFRLIQVFSNGAFSPIGDPVAGMILSRY